MSLSNVNRAAASEAPSESSCICAGPPRRGSSFGPGQQQAEPSGPRLHRRRPPRPPHSPTVNSLPHALPAVSDWKPAVQVTRPSESHHRRPSRAGNRLLPPLQHSDPPAYRPSDRVAHGRCSRNPMPEVLDSDFIQVGVNVTVSSGTPGKENRPRRPRSGSVQPVRTYICVQI